MNATARSEVADPTTRAAFLLEQASEALRQRDEEIDDMRALVAALLEHVPELAEAPGGTAPVDTTRPSKDSLPPGAG